MVRFFNSNVTIGQCNCRINRQCTFLNRQQNDVDFEIDDSGIMDVDSDSDDYEDIEDESTSQPKVKVKMGRPPKAFKTNGAQQKRQKLRSQIGTLLRKLLQELVIPSFSMSIRIKLNL